MIYHCHFCPTDEAPWAGHGSQQQPGERAAAGGHRRPRHLPEEDGCTQHPAQVLPVPHLLQERAEEKGEVQRKQQGYGAHQLAYFNKMKSIQNGLWRNTLGRLGGVKGDIKKVHALSALRGSIAIYDCVNLEGLRAPISHYRVTYLIYLYLVKRIIYCWLWFDFITDPFLDCDITGAVLSELHYFWKKWFYVYSTVNCYLFRTIIIQLNLVLI